MSLFPGPSNPIAYAQFRLGGGFKLNGLIAGGGTLVLAMLVYTTALDGGVFQTRRLAGLSETMLGFEALILLVFGSFRVDAAIRADVNSRMIDSHRLMPSSAFGAVMGYLLLAPCTAVALSVPLVAVGLGCALVGGGNGGAFLASAAFVFLFAVFVWALVARIAFESRGGFLLALIFCMLALIWQSESVLPALDVLAWPVVGSFDLRRWGAAGASVFPCLISVAGQVALIAVFAAATSRRFRSASLIGFTPGLGVVLVLLWALISLAGMVPGLQFGYRHWRGYSSSGGSAGLVGSLIAAMALAALPISAAARQSAGWARWGPSVLMPTKPGLAAWTAVAAVLAVAVLLVVTPAYPSTDSARVIVADLATILVLTISAAELVCLLEWFYLAADRAIVILLVWFFITWVAPLLVAAMVGAITDETRTARSLVALSQPGLIDIIWDSGGYLTSRDQKNVAMGLTFQLVLAAGPVLLLVRRRANRRLRPAVSGSTGADPTRVLPLDTAPSVPPAIADTVG